MFLNPKRNQKGFTLLELLVVIGIIAVLVGIGSVSFSTAQQKSRNAKRQGDLQAIRNALEQYYSICGYSYPTPRTGGYYSQIICRNPRTVIMVTVPVDPKTTTPYLCPTPIRSKCNRNKYTICAKLEPTGQFCVTNSQ